MEKSTMQFEFIPASFILDRLLEKISSVSLNLENDWFFYTGAFEAPVGTEAGINTWLHENFVITCDGEIIGYFEGHWDRSRDVIMGRRCINLSKNKSIIFVHSVFKYFDYLFECRGCMALNWCVALQNRHATLQYDRLVENYCGQRIGITHDSQRSFTGQISDCILYEITRDEYFEWKQRGYKKRKNKSLKC